MTKPIKIAGGALLVYLVVAFLVPKLLSLNGSNYLDPCRGPRSDRNDRGGGLYLVGSAQRGGGGKIDGGIGRRRIALHRIARG